MFAMSIPPPRSRHVVLHELRSPVTAIIGLADTLTRSAERGALPQENLLERLQRIRTAAVRINSLLDELATSGE
jgi:signal transduction histidine kinase